MRCNLDEASPEQRRTAKMYLRVGEALNPGPASGTVELGPVCYRDPSQEGFYGAVGQPAVKEDNGARAAGTLGLAVETCNATAWGPLRRHLRRTKAHIVLAQEHHLGPSEVAARSAWALRAGWHSVFAPAEKGDNNGWRAGVAIFARPSMGLSLPRVGGHIIVPHRAVAACVEPPGHRLTTLVSLYLEDGKGVGRANLEHLAAVGNFLEAQGEGIPFIAGGDFQSEPGDLAAVGFASRTAGEIVAAGSPRGTCRSGRHASEIDYFIVQKRMAVGVESVTTVETAGTRPHVPVRLTFIPRMVSARALVLRQPPRISTERVFGPLPPPPEWAEVAREVADMVQRTRDPEFVADDAFQRDYEAAYQRWADLAELEIAAASADAEPLPVHGTRGRRPELRWRSVLPERLPPQPHGDDDLLTAWRNLANAATDIRRVILNFLPMTDADVDDLADDTTDDDGVETLLDARATREEVMRTLTEVREALNEMGPVGRAIHMPWQEPCLLSRRTLEIVLLRMSRCPRASPLTRRSFGSAHWRSACTS